MNGTAGSNGSFIPNFASNLHTVLHSDYISLHSHQHCQKVLFPEHPLQHLLFSVFSDDSHSYWCEVISACSFDLRFSNNEQY